MKKPFIMVAPNGARRSKADHPAVPITTSEIVETGRACHAAGADALHLHVRDDQGAHSLDPGRYQEALQALARAVPGPRIQISTEAVGIYGVAGQLACLEQVRPGQDSDIFALGRYASGRTSAAADLEPFLAALPDAPKWMVCAFGPQEHACLVHGAAKGGSLRVGFENSRMRADGRPHTDNAASVAALCNRLERTPS